MVALSDEAEEGISEEGKKEDSNIKKVEVKKKNREIARRGNAVEESGITCCYETRSISESPTLP